jgi:DNA-binding protein H-NS
MGDRKATDSAHNKGDEHMTKRSLLEEKHRLLRETLHKNLNKKHAMEINIRQQLEELKTLEICIEKTRVTQDEPMSISYLRKLE